jgi:hypothetical protein
MEKYKVLRKIIDKNFYPDLSEGELEDLIEEQVKRGWKLVSLSHNTDPNARYIEYIMVFSKKVNG